MVPDNRKCSFAHAPSTLDSLIMRDERARRPPPKLHFKANTDLSPTGTLPTPRAETQDWRPPTSKPSVSQPIRRPTTGHPRYPSRHPPARLGCPTVRTPTNQYIAGQIPGPSLTESHIFIINEVLCLLPHLHQSEKTGGI